MTNTRMHGLQKVSVNLGDTFQDYFVSRARQHVYDSYADIPMLKLPESLRVYDHLIWQSNANVVVEIGCLYGGSTLWFRDRLESFSRYKSHREYLVIAVDSDIGLAKESIAKLGRRAFESIVFIEHDIRKQGLLDKLLEHLPKMARPLIVEDSAHTYETTLESLKQIASLVQKGGYFIVEDGYLDGPLREAFKPDELEYNGIKFGGMTKAITDWLMTSQGQKFKIRDDLEFYGLSGMPNGILERVID